MSKKILVPIANGTEEIEAVTIIDGLRRADADVTVASVEDALQVTASRGVKLVADLSIDDCVTERGASIAPYDLIALPGGMPGAEHLRDSEPLTMLLKRQQQEGRLYAAICAAPVVVLQYHGLLVGRRATCHPAFAEQLKNDEAVEQRVVVDGPCITSRGPGTALEFTLKLIELLYDTQKAQEIGKHMLANVCF
jgi:4-methyl-5(b-hydroxyethyl)-thiazole monophosphate biosynthesis